MTITCIAIALVAFVWKTYADLLPMPVSLAPDASDVSRIRILDRNNVPLTMTYQNRWNTYDYVPLHEMPEFLRQVFIVSEDKRFYTHSGVD